MYILVPIKLYSSVPGKLFPSYERICSGDDPLKSVATSKKKLFKNVASTGKNFYSNRALAVMVR